MKKQPNIRTKRSPANTGRFTFRNAVPLAEVPQYLGGSIRQIETLYRADILKPLVPPTGRGSVRSVVFGRLHRDEILEKLNKFPVIAGHKDTDYHPLSYACQRGAGPFENLFSRILEGDLPCWRGPGKVGIGRLLVNLHLVLRPNIPE